MITNEQIMLENVFIPLKKLLDENKITNGTVELVSPQLRMNPAFKTFKYTDANGEIVFQSNQKYIDDETVWYDSMNRNIKGSPMENNKMWSQVVADKNGNTNSNYGWCVFSPENGDGIDSQYTYAKRSLLDNKNSRQAVVFYNRPSMHWEWNANGMHDFTCTIDTHFLIRNDKLIYIINQRSCDVFFGLTFDWYHHCSVYEKLYNDLIKTYPELQYGEIIYNADSLHIYEQHFKKLTDIVERSCVK
jgi:thymidylate synthase